MAESKRIDQLDGIRALAILLVFFNHAAHVKLFWAGVDLFFILSGFLITGILIGAKGGSFGQYIGHFYSRRVRRILPPYLMLLAVTSLFFGVHWTKSWYLYAFLMNTFTLLHGTYLESFTPLWSLAVEEQFYFLWPLVIFVCSEAWIGIIAAGFIVLAPLLRGLSAPLFPTYEYIYQLTPFRMDLLAVGGLLALLWRHHRALIERYGQFGPVLSVAGCAGLLLLGRQHVTISSNTSFSNVVIYELTLFISVGIILWALSGRYVGILRHPVLVYLGRISYTFYLVHLLIIVLLRPYLADNLPLYLLASFTLTVLYSAASWHFYEKPILYSGARTRVRKESEEDVKAVTLADARKTQSS